MSDSHPPAFDRYGQTYAEQVEHATGMAGATDFFTEVKAQVLLEVAGALLGPVSQLAVLDVGCGPGLADGFLIGKVGSMTGVDVSPAMISQARAANPGAQYEHYDGVRLPFADGAFDVAFAINVLHHIDPPDRPAFMLEVARVTRRGGVFLIFEHNPANPLTRLVVSRCEFDEGVHLLWPRETRQLLRHAAAPPVEARYILFVPARAAILRKLERFLTSVPLGAQYVIAGRRE